MPVDFKEKNKCGSVIKFISHWEPYLGQLKSAPSTYASKEPIVFLTGTWNPLSICQFTVGVLEYNPPLFAGDARPHRGPRTRLLDTTCHIYTGQSPDSTATRAVGCHGPVVVVH